MNKERLLKIIRKPHISEKASEKMENNNTLLFKVDKKSTKLDIKLAVSEIFSVKVKKIRTQIVKGKTKYYRKKIIHHSSWKKAYITLEKNQKLDFISKQI